MFLPLPQPYGSNPGVDGYQCPSVVQTQQFSFCYYGEGVGGPSVWTVSLSGVMLAAPEVSGSGHWFITSALGTRVQTGVSPSSVNVTGLGLIPVDASGLLDNQLSSSYPFLSQHGIVFNLQAPVQQPTPAGSSTAPAPTATIVLQGAPPCEVGTCSTAQYAQGWSAFVVQPLSQGAIACGAPGTSGGLPLTSLNFGYTATPRAGAYTVNNTNAAQPPYFTSSTAPSGTACTAAAAGSQTLACPAWSACVSATLQAVGPLFLPSPNPSSQRPATRWCRTRQQARACTRT